MLPSSSRLDAELRKSKVASGKVFFHFKQVMGRHNLPSLELPYSKVTLGTTATILVPTQEWNQQEGWQIREGGPSLCRHH